MLHKYKKIPYVEFLPVILISFILYRVVNNIEYVFTGLEYIFSILSYIVWAYVIAYILNPLMVYIEKKLKTKRVISVILVYAIFIAFIAFIIMIIVPALVGNTSQLLDSVPKYISKTQKFLQNKIADLQTKDKYNIQMFFQQNIDGFLKSTNNILNFSLNFIIQKALDITSIIVKIIFGIIISIYFLFDKEKLINNLKSALYACLKKEHSNMIIKVGNEFHVAFSKYILGKIIDSIIVGIICFIGLTMLNSPYALLISIIIGVTNLIPYVGGFVGLIFGGLIVLLVSPIKALWVLAFLILLQQVDAWILSPKIIGGSIGLSPLFTIIAIVIGGGLYGILGMFVAIPIAAVLKKFAKSFIDRRLKEKAKRPTEPRVK